MNKFLNWIDNHLPVWCARCGYVMFKKDAIYESTQTGHKVALCEKCHDAIFNPFSDESRRMSDER